MRIRDNDYCYLNIVNASDVSYMRNRACNTTYLQGREVFFQSQNFQAVPIVYERSYPVNTLVTFKSVNYSTAINLCFALRKWFQL